jgi:hypothetical protein
MSISINHQHVTGPAAQRYLTLGNFGIDAQLARER